MALASIGLSHQLAYAEYVTDFKDSLYSRGWTRFHRVSALRLCPDPFSSPHLSVSRRGQLIKGHTNRMATCVEFSFLLLQYVNICEW